MSKHFVVDGYNLLYALAEMPGGRWEDKRKALLARLASERPQGQNRLTVVFDSRQGLGDRADQGDIRVLYPAGQTADDWIIAYVRKTPNPRVVIVVTDDQGIRQMIRGTGAAWMGTQDFLKQGQTKRNPGRTYETLDPDDITEELKKKWL
jgi:predicted RNA-binding protein with PIN domain